MPMDEEVAEAQRQLWGLGNYPQIARQLLPISAEVVAACAIGPGDRVLDVATGTGNAAAEAARRGATVSALDVSPTQIERARERLASEGLRADLRVGNAEALDWPDASFDAVVSVMGVIFAPDHQRAAAELARVCRPGGAVAMTAWYGGGWFVKWQARAADLFPTDPASATPVGPAPDEWGDADEMRRRLEGAGLTASVTERPFAYQFGSIDEAVQTFVTGAGPFVRMMQAAEDLGRAEQARQVLRE
ncbi:MAG: class I SAM-dependent methyltransferase, partial [Actinomycetota bacterium]